MAGHEADKEVPGHGVDLLQEPGEVHPRQPQVLAVGVDVLAQEGDVPISGLGELPDLGQNVLGPPGPLPPPDIGDDAVGAEIVAAVHDGDPGLDGALPPDREALGDGAGLVGGVEDAAPAGEDPPEELREPPEGVGPEDQVHVAEGLPELLHVVGLLHHAAAQAEDLAGVGLFLVDQGPHVAQHPLLGVLPDGAGIDDDDVGLGLLFGKAVAHLAEEAPDALRVGLVLLAPVGVHKGQGGRGQGGVPLPDLGAEVPLPGNVVEVDPCGVLHEEGSSRGKIGFHNIVPFFPGKLKPSPAAFLFVFGAMGSDLSTLPDVD